MMEHHFDATPPADVRTSGGAQCWCCHSKLNPREMSSSMYVIRDPNMLLYVRLIYLIPLKCETILRSVTTRKLNVQAGNHPEDSGAPEKILIAVGKRSTCACNSPYMYILSGLCANDRGQKKDEIMHQKRAFPGPGPEDITKS